MQNYFSEKNTNKIPLAFLFLISLAAFLLYFIHPYLTAQFFPTGDFAADMLVGNTITENGYLLNGHYSRFGFNHPGPIFFYYNFFTEKISSLFNIICSNAWIASAASLNFLFYLIYCYLLHKLTNSKSVLISLIAGLPTLAMLGQNIFNVWMPYRIVLPFGVYMISLTLILRRGTRYLPVATFFAGILIHGYVTMPVITFLPLFAILLARKVLFNEAPNKNQIIASALIIFLFLSPLLLDKIINPDSNLSNIISAKNHLRTAPTPSVTESITYTLSFWKPYNFLYVAALFFFIFTIKIVKIKNGMFHSLILDSLPCIAVTVTFFLYHLTAPLPLYDFMGLYYLGAPITLISIQLHTIISSLSNRIIQTSISLCIIVTSIILFKSVAVPIYSENRKIQQ